VSAARWGAVAGLVLLLAAVPSGAQESSGRRVTPPTSTPPAAPVTPRVRVDLPPVGSLALEGPEVAAPGVLSESGMETLLRNGFPAYLHYRVELWTRGGLFDDERGSVEWDVVVRYEPLSKTFRVARKSGDRVETLGRFERYRDAIAAVERPVRAPIRGTRSRERQYYNVVLDVEVVSNSDLDEVERWLSGELRPSLQGHRNPGTALGNGMRTLITRVLGGQKRQYVTKSETFRGEG
jgi:hypothetical protein